MKQVKKLLAIIAGKAAVGLSRLLGNQGTNFPGKIARRLYNNILKELAQNIDGHTIIITGTNGKTTTTNMIAEIIKENHSTYIHNRAGANMITGITTAFLEETNLLGNRHFEYALLETDEANVPLLLKEVKADCMLITNFFRDQLDRYGELDHTINLIKNAVKSSNIELVLNADDPLMVDFEPQTGLKCRYYGFDQTRYDTLQGAASREGRYCVICGHELNYLRYHYAQLGKYECPQCNTHNPQRNFTGHQLKMSPAIYMMVDDIKIESHYQGIYNAYNILAAVAVGKLLNINSEVIQRAIINYEPRAGRMETFYINGKKAILILVKNPTGLNQTLSMLGYDNRCKNLFIALNDNAADGRDISWIWDADLEILNEQETEIKQIVCSGQRSGDMAVRIKYSGFASDRIRIETALQEGIEQTVYNDSEICYILCTYTALFKCRKILIKLQKTGRRQGESEVRRQRGMNNA